MRSSLAATLSHIRRSEGGWANDRADPGGCTMLGITLATWRAHGHPKATCAGLRRIQWARDAAPIYVESYWQPVAGDSLPAGVDLLVTDHAVNAGLGRARRLLQEVLRVKVDGDLGPKTLAAAWAAADADLPGLISRVCDARRAYYRSLPGYKRFGRGWEARVDAARAGAYGLVEGSRQSDRLRLGGY
jgi:lysozyme family protein